MDSAEKHSDKQRKAASE